MAFFVQINTAVAQDGSRIIYVSRIGTKHHYVKDCSGMTNPLSMTLSQAISKGKKPCSNCVHDGGDSGSAGGGTGGGTGGTAGKPSQPAERPSGLFWMSMREHRILLILAGFTILE